MEKTVTSVLMKTCERYPNKAAIKYKSESNWQALSWTEYLEQIFTCAKGMIYYGLETDSYVTILSSNCKEWVISNLAAIAAKSVPAGIYPTSSKEQCEYIINHCKASVVVVEDEKQLKKIEEIYSQLESVKFILLINGESKNPKVVTWSKILQKGKEIDNQELNKRIESQKKDDTATLVYTSGTTANPKAVMLSHENLTWTAEIICLTDLKLNNKDHLISYLPLSHIAEQMTSIHGPIYAGACVWFAESLEKLPENLQDVQPTVFLGVPRVWEKIQQKMIEKASKNSALKKSLAKWAKKVGLENGRRVEEGLPRTLSFYLADKLIFQKVKKALGLNRCRLQVTAAAPISMDTLEFFLSLNIPLYELYGMSESSGPATISLPGQYKIGMVGKILKKTEVKIAEDEEILLKGKHVFKGYLHNNEATKETIDEDGWLHTGDIGRLDSDGYLQITGRKKNLIITAGGENIAPEMLENKMKEIPGIEQAVVIGDQRKYLTALVTLSESALSLKEEINSEANTLSDLCKCEKFNTYLENKVSSMNESLARVQTIKKFSILDNEFTEDGGELTPTMKIKRNTIHSKYCDIINSLY